MDSPPGSSPTLELLLADAFDHQPTLEQGLPELAASKAPRPDKVPRGLDAMTLEAPDEDPNDLALQRWGIIVPDSPAGQRALEAITELRKLRETEQDTKVEIFSVPTGMDLKKAIDWKNQVLRNEHVLSEEDRPRYLLILGDLDEVSSELGHVLANGSFVGRIHFDDPSGYEAYAKKVVHWDKATSAFEKVSLNFFAAEDGTQATMQGDHYLIKPCHALSLKPTRRPFPREVEEPWTEIEDASALITRCQTKLPSVLLSLCHGVGRSARRPWKSVEEQRRLQGALVLNRSGREGGLLTAENVADKPILPGGFWFAVACFGAGTPSQSAFYRWLKQLEETAQYTMQAERVLRSLPNEGEKPFLAALPKALLANPNGPLGFIGHLDLAWTYSFLDPTQTLQSRASRIFSSLQVMSKGSRAGVALDALMRSYREVNDELLSGYQAEEDARVWNRTYEVDPAKRAHAFMLRNDLRGYVLLGDPAARLPLARKT